MIRLACIDSLEKGFATPPLQVKDCPTEVYERLRACAARENRSIAQQTLTIIEEYLGMRPASNPEPVSASNPAPRRLSGEHARPRLLYSNEEQDDTDYLSTFRERLKLFDDLPPIPVSERCPRSDVILAQIREEEAR